MRAVAVAVQRRGAAPHEVVAADEVRAGEVRRLVVAPGGLVGDAAFVVPVADAGVGLPWGRGDAVEDATFAIEGAGADGAVLGGFAEVDGLDFAIVFGGAHVVDLGYGGVAVLVEGDAAIGVEEVGLVLVDEVLDAAEVLKLPAVGCARRLSCLGVRTRRRDVPAGPDDLL